jgi:hypothetical protein
MNMQQMMQQPMAIAKANQDMLARMEANMNACQKETTTCQEATETEPDPEMIQSIEEHQEIPKGEAAVMPVGELRKQHRVPNLAAKCRQKMKERTWGNSRSRSKSTATCRKVSHRAKVE